MTTNKKTRATQYESVEVQPEDASSLHPGKKIKAEEKVEIKQSGFGREQSQIPADEHLSYFSQIDEASAKNASNESDVENHEGLRKTLNSDDDRDGEDSRTDWEAQNNRSGRHK